MSLACPSCHLPIRAYSDVTLNSEFRKAERGPTVGSIGFCLNCGEWWEMFELDILIVYQPTVDEIKAVTGYLVRYVQQQVSAEKEVSGGREPKPGGPA